MSSSVLPKKTRRKSKRVASKCSASKKGSRKKSKRTWRARNRQSINFDTFGKVKEFAKPNESYLDIDAARAPKLSGINSLAHILGVVPLFVRCDRTRRGWHIVIRWSRKFQPIEHVAIQAILGSDYRRETLNLMRVLSGPRGAGTKRWNLLYSGKLTGSRKR